MAYVTLSAKPCAMVLDVAEIDSPKGTVSKNINYSLAHVAALQQISHAHPPSSPTSSESQNSDEMDPDQDPESNSIVDSNAEKVYACDKMFKENALQGAALHHRNALRYFEDKEFAKATDEFVTALELDPQNAPALSDLGVLHFFEQRFDEAVQCFEEALKYDENHSGSQFNLGLIYGGRGQISQAKKQLERCIAHNPKHTNAMMTLADILRNEGRVAEANEMVRSAHSIESAKAALQTLPATPRDSSASQESERERELLGQEQQQIRAREVERVRARAREEERRRASVRKAREDPFPA